jgi:hypothetical protein
MGILLMKTLFLGHSATVAPRILAKLKTPLELIRGYRRAALERSGQQSRPLRARRVA